jgi:hypothetical protein
VFLFECAALIVMLLFTFTVRLSSFKLFLSSAAIFGLLWAIVAHLLCSIFRDTILRRFLAPSLASVTPGRIAVDISADFGVVRRAVSATGLKVTTIDPVTSLVPTAASFATLKHLSTPGFIQRRHHRASDTSTQPLLGGDGSSFVPLTPVSRVSDALRAFSTAALPPSGSENPMVGLVVCSRLLSAIRDPRERHDLMLAAYSTLLPAGVLLVISTGRLQEHARAAHAAGFVGVNVKRVPGLFGSVFSGVLTAARPSPPSPIPSYPHDEDLRGLDVPPTFSPASSV